MSAKQKPVNTPLHLLQQLSGSLLEHLESACSQALADAEKLLAKLEKQRGKAQEKLHKSPRIYKASTPVRACSSNTRKRAVIAGSSGDRCKSEMKRVVIQAKVPIKGILSYHSRIVLIGQKSTLSITLQGNVDNRGMGCIINDVYTLLGWSYPWYALKSI